MDDLKQPLISIIISTRGTAALVDCVKSCQLALGETKAEIIVVVDKDRKLPFLSNPALENILVLHSEREGVTNTRNTGLMAAKGKCFLLLDEDCLIPSATLIQEVIARSEGGEYLNGGSYSVSIKSSYFVRIYNLTNRLWLLAGQEEDGSAVHLLGGFLFGSERIQSHVRFRPDIKWGGEEKELLTRLKKEQGIKGKFHPDLAVIHVDKSGIKKFYKRAVRQGIAAGHYNLRSKFKIMRVSVKMLPGLILFYFLSRMGILIGRYKRLTGISKTA